MKGLGNLGKSLDAMREDRPQRGTKPLQPRNEPQSRPPRDYRSSNNSQSSRKRDRDSRSTPGDFHVNPRSSRIHAKRPRTGPEIEFNVCMAYEKEDDQSLFRVRCVSAGFKIQEKIYLRDLKGYYDPAIHGKLPTFDIRLAKHPTEHWMHQYQKYYGYLKGGTKPKVGILNTTQGVTLYLLPPSRKQDPNDITNVYKCAFKAPKIGNLGVSPQRRKEIHRDNPHLKQNTEEYKTTLEEFDISELRRYLLPDDPKMQYRRRKNELKTVNHWEQRKLLMSEIEFLTEFGEDNDKVVYAGAAPGTHTEFLSELFPHLDFVLVDPADFRCRNTDKITVRQEFFTDEVAKEFQNSKQPILFISDIRTACHQEQNNKEVERAVTRDMEWQMTWHNIMRPKKSMLKFRLPYTQGTKKYFDGLVYLPVWGPQTTSETRLIVDTHPEMKTWDNQEYENLMFYFNTVTRVQYFRHDVESEGVDHCFDCASEILILTRYLEKHRPDPPEYDRRAGSLMSRISGKIADGRTLKVIVTNDDKKRWFAPKIFDVDGQDKRMITLDSTGKRKVSERSFQPAKRSKFRTTPQKREFESRHNGGSTRKTGDGEWKQHEVFNERGKNTELTKTKKLLESIDEFL